MIFFYSSQTDTHTPIVSLLSICLFGVAIKPWLARPCSPFGGFPLSSYIPRSIQEILQNKKKKNKKQKKKKTKKRKKKRKRNKKSKKKKTTKDNAKYTDFIVLKFKINCFFCFFFNSSLVYILI